MPAVGEQEKDRIYNFVPAGQCGRYLNKISGGTVKVLELFLPDILNESTFLTVYNELSGMLETKESIIYVKTA